MRDFPCVRVVSEDNLTAETTRRNSFRKDEWPAMITTYETSPQAAWAEVEAPFEYRQTRRLRSMPRSSRSPTPSRFS